MGDFLNQKELWRILMKRDSKCYTQKSWLPYLIKFRIYIVIFFIFILGMSGIFGQNAYAKKSGGSTSKVEIKKGDEWRYFKGKKKPPKEWKNSGFDDSNWQKGNSGFGYGNEQVNGKNKTNLGDMKGNYSTVYVRKNFIIDDASKVINMLLSIDCDGPFIAYLNGIEIIRNNKGMKTEKLEVSGFVHELFPGKNILAVEGSNDDINSNDFSFTPCFELTEDER